MALEKSKSMEANLQTIPENPPPPDLTLCEKIKLVFTNITVEPIMVCYILPSVMASMATQNLYLEKACRVDLHLNETICDALAIRDTLGYTKREEIAVQKLVASAMAWKNILQSLLPSVILMFLGSWSDRRNKRKPCIMLPIFGDILATTGSILCTYYFYELSVIYNVLAEGIPTAVTGGWFSMFMGVYSYISGVTSVETRTLRIGAVNMFSNVSLTVGIALSGVLYRQIGFYGVFFLAMAMYILGFTYGCFWIRENGATGKRKNPEGVRGGGEEEGVEKEGETNKAITREGEEEIKGKDVEEDKSGFLKDFFDLKHITDTMHVAFKDGERNRKRRICVILVLVMVIIGPMHGEMNVMYLFVRYKFEWNEIDYSLYSTFNFVVHMAGTLVSLIVFSKYFKLDDALLGMISSLSKIASCFVYAFAPTPTVFYLGAIVEMLNGTSFIAMRSIISKLVPADELGKIYSLFGVSEALMPLVYGPMYSMVYKSTINVLPGAFFLVGGALTMPAVGIFLWLYNEHKQDELEQERNKPSQEKLLETNDLE